MLRATLLPILFLVAAITACVDEPTSDGNPPSRHAAAQPRVDGDTQTRDDAGVEADDGGEVDGDPDASPLIEAGADPQPEGGAALGCDGATWREHLPDLRGCDLRTATLAGIDLNGADLSGALLEGCDLAGAELDGVRALDLSGCPSQLPQHWSCADQRDGRHVLLGPGAALAGADLAGNSLTGSTLSQIHLERADLRGAKLGGLRFTKSNFAAARLDDADLTGVLFDEADLSQATLTGATVSWLQATGLVGACPALLPDGWICLDLPAQRGRFLIGPGASFQSVDLSLADLSPIGDLSGVFFGDVNLSEAKLTNLVLTDSQFYNSTLAGTDFSGADLTGATLDVSNAAGMRAQNLVACPAGLTNAFCDPSSAPFDVVGPGFDLRGADLSHDLMSYWDLRGADLSGAKLTGADLHGAYIEGTNFSDTDLTGATTSKLHGCPLLLPVGGACALTYKAFGWEEHALLAPGVVLANVNLTASNDSLQGVNLANADLHGARICSLYTAPRNVQGANLRGANLAGAELESCDLQGADLSNADLSGAHLELANLDQAHLDGAEFAGATFQFRVLPVLAGQCPASLPDGFSCVTAAPSGQHALLGSDYTPLPNLDFSGSDLSGVLFAGWSEGAKLSGVSLDDSKFTLNWGSGIDLSFASLKNADLWLQLSDSDLRGANFQGSRISASLFDSDLSQAVFEGATFDSLYMEGSNLSGASFQNAIFGSVVALELSGCPAALPPPWTCVSTLDGRGFFLGPTTSLHGVDLSGLQAPGAQLSNARLEGVDLSGANLAGATLSNASLEGANLEDAELADADLNGAFLDRTQLSRANLAYANLAEADLTDADLTAANLSGANLKGADLQFAQLAGADLSGADLTNAHLSAADLRGAKLVGAKLVSAGLDNAALEGADFSQADLTNVYAMRAWNVIGTCPTLPSSEWSCVTLTEDRLGFVGPRAVLSWLDMSTVDLGAAVLRGATLSGSDLTGADLSASSLSGVYAAHVTGCPAALPPSWTCTAAGGAFVLAGPGVNLYGAVLSGVDLRGVDLTGADLDQCDLEDAQLDGAVLNSVRASGLVGACPGSLPNAWSCHVCNDTDDESHFVIAGPEADLRGAYLVGCDLRGAQLDGADFRNADFHHANVGGLDLSALDLSGVRTGSLLGTCPSALPARWICRPQDIGISLLGPGMVLGYREIFGVPDFSDTDLEGASLYNGIFDFANFSGSNLRNANLTFASIERANFSGTDLRGASFEHVSCYQGPSFAGADLRGARLPAVCWGADYAGAATDGSTLCPDQLYGPCSF